MTKEEIYDEQINPLMAQVLAICKQHKIAMLADFRLDEDLKCTSAILEDDCEPGDSQIKAFAILRPSQGNHFALAETIQTNPDGSKKITISRIR